MMSGGEWTNRESKEKTQKSGRGRLGEGGVLNDGSR